MGCRPSDSSVHGISQARILERVAISFSKGSSQPRNRGAVLRHSILSDYATHLVPLSVGSLQARMLPDPGTVPGSPALQVESLLTGHQGSFHSA